jgi:pimeloyl-ACP methyl ester carboxylesterase
MKNSSKVRTIGDPIGLRYSEAGSGNAVLVLKTSSDDQLEDRLAQSYRVITFEIHEIRDQRAIADTLAGAADQLSITKYCLIADPELAPAAIAHAIASNDSVEALILLAPAIAANIVSIDFPLEKITAPTLVLFGTRDQVLAPETGRDYVGPIPNCFYSLVYDAGHNIRTDRPQALYAIVRDFLEHREKFVIQRESSVVNP